MKLLMYGINRDTVSAEDISRYSLTEASRSRHLRDIYLFDGVMEVVLLVTDNRNEYYLYVDETEFRHGDLLRYLSDYTEKSLEEIILESYSKFNEDVVRHLLDLSSNLNVSEHQTDETVDVIDDALSAALKNHTAKTALKALFKRAMEFSLTLCEKETLKPLMQSEVLKAVRSIKEATNKQDTSVLVIGSDQLTNMVLKHLLSGTLGSLSILDRTNHTQKAVTQLKSWLRIAKQSSWNRYIQVIDSQQLLYRLAKADVIIIGPSEQHSWLSEELLQEMMIMRPTAKHQLVFDFSYAQDETVYHKYESIDYRHIDDEPVRKYTEDRQEAAKTAYDELISSTTSQYMDHFNHLQNTSVFHFSKKNLKQVR
ncbi:Glutamyl-tRNA reductase [Alkalibacterium sp. AK22]|uniref:hypothetical protein n=1 Tax=Alkalibacterium sp. AK22 TaxID=1229520 RepID=UPI000445A7E5|nr:hypothetical protein [Alkalibacterium sp. AK22]EXJ24159.1 Glutamyl-tRNA reductase [Alkalibacterium sp. AK22]